MSRIIYILLILYSTGILAQNLDEYKNNYTPISTLGKLPPELSSSAIEKANAALANLDQKKNPEYKIQKDFFQNTIFHEDRLLKTGNVLFNTKINAYINKIADEILKNDTILRNKLSFFVIRENESNAWAFDNGHIYISLDYIATQKTEAQLAMILCHEISHFLNKHNYKRFVKRAEIVKKMNSTYHKDTLWLKERQFYKEQESLADIEGFDLFKKTGYNKNDIAEMFDLMLLCDYSFENTDFDITYFNSGHLIINPKVFYREIKPLHVNEKYDDTWDTHPNTYKRKKTIEDNITKSEPSEGKSFLISESEFYYVRDICRFETIRTDLKNFQLVPAAYHSYCMLKKYPENQFLHKTIGEVLYQMAVYKSYSKLHGGFFDYLHVKDNSKSNANRDSTLGYISQIKKMFTRLNGEDFTLLAINYNYNQFKKSDFKNTKYKTCLDTLFNLLSHVHNFNYKDFFKSEAEYNKRTVYVSDTSTKNRLFVDAIERKSAFVDLMNDKEFKAFFIDTTSTNEFEIKYISKGKTKSINQGLNKNQDILNGNKKHIQYDKNELKKVNKILIQEPHFDKIIYMKYDIESFPIEAHNNSVFFKTELIKELSSNNIKALSLNDSKFDKEDTEKYNDVALINNIISENDEHYEIPSTKVFNSTSDNKIASKYETPYVLQVYLSQDIYDNVAFYIDGSIFIKVVKDLHRIDYCLDLINIETGTTVYRHTFDKAGKLNEAVMKEQIQKDVENIVNMKNQ